MAVTNGKLEGIITIPTGGVTFATLTDDNATPTAVTLTAGTYTWSSADSGANDFAAQMAADINAEADLTNTWTVTIDTSEGGTGKVTIGNDGSTCTLTWSDLDVRFLVGSGGNLTGSTSYTMTRHAQALWLPDGPPSTPFGITDDGADEHDMTFTESTAGHVMTLSYEFKTVQSVTWSGISRAKTRLDGERSGYDGESFQRFTRQVLAGALVYGPSRRLRLYPDADDDATYTDYRHSGPVPQPEPMVDGWTELWRISLPRLVKVPT